MKTTVYLLSTAGLMLLFVLVAYYGFADIGVAVAAAGWGLLLVTLFHLLPMAADTMAWRALLERERRPGLPALMWMRWVGESVNSLLPAAQVAGDLVRARLAAQHGIPGVSAGASIVVDLTTSVFTLVMFCLLGLALLFARDMTASNLLGILLGLALTALLLFAFYLAQRLGLFHTLARGLARLSQGRDWAALVGGAAALDRAVTAVYQRRGNVLASCAWALAGWMLGAGEVWLALYFLGAPVDLREALILESLVQAIRSAAFPVPGALGVQEGGLLLLGTRLGLTPELALALSLVKRVRELLLGVPGLLSWHLAEGRRLLRRGVQP